MNASKDSNCDFVDEHVLERLYGELEGPACDAFDRHVAHCEACRETVQRHASTVDVLRAWSSDAFERVPAAGRGTRPVSRWWWFGAAAALVFVAFFVHVELRADGLSLHLGTQPARSSEANDEVAVATLVERIAERLERESTQRDVDLLRVLTQLWAREREDLVRRVQWSNDRTRLNLENMMSGLVLARLGSSDSFDPDDGAAREGVPDEKKE